MATSQSTSIINRFWVKVRKGTGCWEWIGAKRSGYGRCWYGSRVQTAHRVSWILVHGEISNEQLVCHRCDNRACVRPDHLFLGTQLDNVRDMIAKGRCSRHVLSPSAMRAIRERFRRQSRPFARDGNSLQLALEYGVTRHTVWAIANGHYRRARKELSDE